MMIGVFWNYHIKVYVFSSLEVSQNYETSIVAWEANGKI